MQQVCNKIALNANFIMLYNSQNVNQKLWREYFLQVNNNRERHLLCKYFVA